MSDTLTPEILSSMNDRQRMFTDLSSNQQTELISRVVTEFPDQGLAGEATQALVGSVYGLIAFGVRRVRKPLSSSDKMFSLEDGVHHYIAHVDLSAILQRYLSSGRSLAGFLVGRVFAETVRAVGKFGEHHVKYPINPDKIIRALEEKKESSWQPLEASDFEDAMNRSGHSNNSRNPNIARAIWHIHGSTTVEEERISIEDEAEHRLSVESDWCDDELVAPSSIVTDPNSEGEFDDAITRADASAFVGKLNWSALSPHQTNVINDYFGLNGFPPLNLREIGNRYGRSKQAIALAKDSALIKLRSSQVNNHILKNIKKY